MTGAEEACEAALRQAEVIYGRVGQVLPCMWAIGLRRSVYAVPNTPKAMDHRPQLLVGVHAVLASEVDAHWIGSTHEVWSQEREAGSEIPARGDLERMSATDPSVRTSIVVHVLDVKTAEVSFGMSRLGLDRLGRPTWDSDLHDDVRSPVMDNLGMAAKLCREMDAPVDPEAVLTWLDWSAVWNNHEEVM